MYDYNQAVADAYYVLSDTKRRREYDVLYNARRDRTADPGSSSSFFGTTGGTQPNPEGVFADVFDEVRPPWLHKSFWRRSSQLLRPDVERHVPWWTYLGTVCGAGIGFIVANFPGLMLGAVSGNRLGAIRDAKGKSVAAVFNDLGGQQKAEVSTFSRWSLLSPLKKYFPPDFAGFGNESFGFSSLIWLTSAPLEVT